MNKITVLLVDDHSMFRESLNATLRGYDDIEVIGEAVDGKEAVEKVKQLVPQVVLMDIGMPNMSGLEASRQIHIEQPDIPVIALTQHENSDLIMSLLKVGVNGYIAKTATVNELVTAIRQVSRGEAYLYPVALDSLVKQYLTLTGGSVSEYDGLTSREKEILQLVAEDLNTRQIAEKLCLSVKTILKYRSSIMEKLGFHNRTELIKYAIAKGIIDMPGKVDIIK